MRKFIDSTPAVYGGVSEAGRAGSTLGRLLAVIVAMCLLMSVVGSIVYGQEKEADDAGPVEEAKPGFGADQPAGGDADAGAPEAVRQTRINFTLDAPSATTLILPRYSNWVVGFFENAWRGSGRVLVLDVRTGRRIALTTKAMELDNPLLSADGTLLSTTKTEGWGKDGKTTLSIWNIRQMQEIGKIDFPGAAKVTVLDFIGNDQIVVAPEYTRSTPESIEVWAVGKKQIINAIPIGDTVNVLTLALDPTGKVLVFANNRIKWGTNSDVKIPMLELIDIQTGKRVLKQPETKRYEKASVLGTRFSPDGKRLAVALSNESIHGINFNGSTIEKVVVFDVASGDVFGLLEMPEQDTTSSGYFFDGDTTTQPLQWTADGKRILVSGGFLFDVELGEQVYEVPFANDAAWSTRGIPRLLLGNEYILRSTSFRDARSNNSMLKFTGARLPLDQINKALEAIKQGGDLIDGWLPKAAEPLVNKPAVISLAGAVRKPFELDSQVSSPNISDKPLELTMLEKQTEQASGASRHVLGNRFGRAVNNQLVFAAVDSDKCLAYTPVKKDADGSVSRGIALLDLSRPGVINSFIELTGGEPVALSPDGSRFIVRYQRGAGTRLDVMETSTGRIAAKQLVGWVPYPTVKSKQNGDNIRWTAMPSSDFVLTLSTHGELIGWQLPDLKPVYTIPMIKGEPRLSPGAKQLFFYSGQSVYCADTRTGRVIANVTGPLPDKESLNLAINPQSTQIAVMYPSRHLCQMIQIYPVGEVKDPQQWEYYVSSNMQSGAGYRSSGNFMYTTENHLILPNGLMLDTTLGTAVVNYQFPRESTTISMGRVWRLNNKPPTYSSMGTIQTKNETVLESIRVPSSNIMELGKKMQRADFVVYEAPRHVRVEFSPPGEVPEGPALRESIIEIIRKNGYTIDDNASFVFRVNANIQDDPDRVYQRFNRMGGFNRGQSSSSEKYQGKRLVGRAEFYRDGKLLWAADSIYRSPSFLTSIREGADVNAAIAKATWELYPFLVTGIANQFPALMMDYSRLEQISLWGTQTTITKANTAGDLATLTPEVVQRYKNEVRLLKAFRVSATNWGEKALQLHKDTVENKNDARKFRMEADEIQRDTRLLAAITEPISESSLQTTNQLRANALEIAKLYQQAYRIAAQRQAGVRTKESPDALVAQVKTIYDKQFTAGLTQIGQRITELEEVIKNAPAPTE